MDKVKREISKSSWRGILQVFLIGLVGFIMGVAITMYAAMKYI